MDYKYKKGRDRVNFILNDKNNVEVINKVPDESQFSYDNGFYSDVTALFVDIKDSTKLFGENKRNSTSKIIRAFTSEIIEILNYDDNLREIGIRGDCVYAIYTCSTSEENYQIAKKAIYINTYIKMLNEMLLKKKMETINVGIGVVNGKELVIMAGREGTEISNLVWVGEAVSHASKFSGIAGRAISDPIIFSKSFYNSIVNQFNSSLCLYDVSKSRKRHNAKIFGVYYSCDIKIKEFNQWIDGGMK